MAERLTKAGRQLQQTVERYNAQVRARNTPEKIVQRTAMDFYHALRNQNQQPSNVEQLLDEDGQPATFTAEINGRLVQVQVRDMGAVR